MNKYFCVVFKHLQKSPDRYAEHKALDITLPHCFVQFYLGLLLLERVIVSVMFNTTSYHGNG